MPLLDKLAGPLMAVVTHRLQHGADSHLRRFLFDAQLRGRLCAQLETLASAMGVSGALDLEPDTEDRGSAPWRERYEWLEKHWSEAERLALEILFGRTGER